ncbi:MAG: hypothetical protein CM1200mP11_4920 [Nitrosopumilaceae archaeon]|nr:MAG: hypothetical protein CM1200mP11_4920 [Nitrosopumilaceae archaeon]
MVVASGAAEFGTLAPAGVIALDRTKFLLLR